MKSNIVKPNNIKNVENIEKNKKCILFKDNKIYRIKVSIEKNELLITYRNYEFRMGYKDLEILTKSWFKSLEDAYYYFISLFEENRIQMKIKKKKKNILLLLTIYAHNKEKQIELTLKYINKDKVISNLKEELIKLEDIISNYQKQNKELENENKILKNVISNYQVKDQKLENDNKALKNIISNYQIKNEKFENENKALKNIIFDYQVKFQNLENENKTLKNVITNYKVKFQYLENENKTLKIIISKYLEKNQNLENEIKNLKIINSIHQVKNQNFENDMITLKSNSIYNYETSINFIYYNSDIKPNNIINDSYAYDNLDNTFTLFKSINNQLYLIYANERKSIIIYDILRNQKINEIKEAHNYYITNFRHYWDKFNNRDLIISISCNDNNLKVWDFKNLNCICNIENINNTGALDSACIFKYYNQNYIITSNDIDNDMNEENEDNIYPESIKIYDFNGNKIKVLNDSNYNTYIIDTYYDIKKNKTYIITGNKGFVQSYDYEKNEKYFRYSEYPNNINETDFGNCSIIINSYNNMIRLFETCWDGNIRIWNFHAGELIIKIKIDCLQGLCLNNNNYLYVGCDNYIKVIDLTNGKIIKSLEAHDKEILTIKTIIHPQMGEILISQGAEDGQIKIWHIYTII